MLQKGRNPSKLVSVWVQKVLQKGTFLLGLRMLDSAFAKKSVHGAGLNFEGRSCLSILKNIFKNAQGPSFETYRIEL